MTTHRGRPPNQTKTLHKPSSKNEIVNMYKLNESVTYNDIGETDDAFCFYKGRVDIKRGIEANYNQIIGNESVDFFLTNKLPFPCVICRKGPDPNSTNLSKT